MRIVPTLQLTTICAKRRRCDAMLDILARGYLPSPRPFFHRTRGDPCIKAFFLLAMALETTISFNHSFTTKLQDSYNSNPILASMLFIVSITIRLHKCLRKFSSNFRIDHFCVIVCVLYILQLYNCSFYTNY